MAFPFHRMSVAACRASRAEAGFFLSNANCACCYNSQASGAAVTTPPCGITLLNHSQGNNKVDFGFQVSERFVQLTAVLTAQSYNAGAGVVGALMQFNFPGEANANQVWVETFNTNGQGGNHGDVSTPFYIFIY